MKRILLTLLLIGFCCQNISAQIVQTVEISSSPNPVGSGARALGMGGAFIGIADDATAASWNPAGLIQLETPEVSIVVAYNERREDTTYVAYPEASGPQSVTLEDINYLSSAYPFTLFRRNMIVSLNWQHLYDFNKTVGYSYTHTAAVGPLNIRNNLDYEQEGAFRALSPAMAFQITPFVSFGFTLNFWDYGFYSNRWHSDYLSRGNGTFAGFPVNTHTTIKEEYEMQGTTIDLLDPMHCRNFNYHLGLMWNINSMFTIGAVFKAPFEARLKHSYHYDSTINYPTFPAANSRNRTDRIEHMTLNMPMAYGLGFAVRFSDAFSMDLDFYRTEWGDYQLTDPTGRVTNPISGKPQTQSSVDATVQVRLGGEYLIIGYPWVVPIRAGIFYDPEPAEGSPDDFYGFSIGSGFAYREYVFDFAYQYRFGRGVRSVNVGNEDSTQDVDQHTIYASFIYHF